MSIALAVALTAASGFAALGYQIVWTQQAALWLGQESAAVLAVIAAFFGGLALGALALGRRIDESAHPARWYAGCEAAIGAWSLALTFLMAPVTGALLELIGAQPSPLWHWTVAFGGTFVLLLPATAAMGATLPAMERVVTSLRVHGARIAVLYTANTLGAIAGVLAVAFALIPALGLARTAAMCVALNLACAAAAMALGPCRSDGRQAGPSDPVSRAAARRWLALLAVTGLLGIGYEVLAIRVLSQIAENTVYTFALLLAVYLAGTSLGAAAYGRLLLKAAAHTRLRDALLHALSLACIVGMSSLAAAPVAKSAIVEALGPGMASALAAEAVVAIGAFLPPTLVMGALFCHLSASARAAGASFGAAIGVNTLGAALAPPLFGVALLPVAGLKLCVVLVALGYLLLSSRQAWTKPLAWAGIAAPVAFAGFAPALDLTAVPEGGRTLRHIEGVSATVSVVEDADGVARLTINNRQQEGSSATLYADARQAVLPLLLHPSPHRALFLGWGTGLTARAAAREPALRVDAVELLPEVVAASAHFAPLFGETDNLRVMVADARRYVRASPQRYDVVVADNFHPARSGSGTLYTVEHFAAVRERLAEGGVFCQWLPLHQLDLDTLKSIVRTFLAVYPEASAMLATNSLDTPVVGLVARTGGRPFNREELRERLADAGAVLHAPELGVADDLALFGSFIGGPHALAAFAADAPVNTDDRPVVAYRAPRITYAPDSPPRDRLIALLRQMEPGEGESIAASDVQWESRLAAYRAARNRFIEAGRDVAPSQDVRRMLAQVREPLLAVLKESPDFRPAYDPLLRMAIALTRVDADGARKLLEALQRAQPSRPEAGAALRELDAAP